MREATFVLTTIGNGMVAIVETSNEAKRQRGEYTLSKSCVERNVTSGKFVDMTDIATGAEGKVFALKSDLTND